MAAPKIIPYDVELRSVNPVRSFDRPKAYTNDLNSVRFQFKVLDMTSEELATATAVTLVYMRDGSFFANPSTDVSRVGNVFSYLLKENEGNHAGVAQIQLVVTVDGMGLASQLFDFEIINGLETKVAQEVMIYDWTTLTRDAQDYIDQFISNEATRQQQFADAQTQRSTTFGESEAGRTTIFNASEAGRTTTFNASEAGRTTAFNAAEEARATGYDADHSRAGIDHTTAVNDSILAGTDHTTAVNDHTLAGTDHSRAEADHTRADADSATVAGFNTRLTAEETATAANKVSAVKSKTFADVDARFEDVEFDTAMMGTNLVTNGDFSNGSNWWGPSGGTFSVSNGISTFTATTQWGGVLQSIQTVTNNSYYVRGLIFGTTDIYFGRNTSGKYLPYNGLCAVSTIFKATGSSALIGIGDRRASDWTPVTMDNVIAIDLTATFGAGNEPTVEQMDTVMAKFTNSWFDGTKNLFRANAALNKLMVVDARTEFEARNEVVNGDFSNGTTGWLPAFNYSTLAAANNILTVTQAMAGGWNIASYTSSEVIKPGDKYYIRCSAKPSTTTSLLGIRKQLTSNAIFSTSGALIAGTWYTLAGIWDTTGSSGKFEFRIDDATSSGIGATFDVKNVIAINLTKAFGAGKEPTLAEMDRLMARFPNSWFDGVKPIQTIETLYQEKANKVQEAWITPTFTNGATGTLQYRKNENGRVEFKGNITGGAGVTLITLPSGYRPPVGFRDVSSNPSGIATVNFQVSSTGTFYITYPYGEQSLEMTGKSFPTV